MALGLHIATWRLPTRPWIFWPRLPRPMTLRIEYRICDGRESSWHPALPKSFVQHIAYLGRRLLCRTVLDDSAFLHICAQRIVDENSTLAEREIVARIACERHVPHGADVQIRLVSATWFDTHAETSVVFESKPMALTSRP